MISLNDYLYDGDTVLKILHRYSQDLAEHGEQTKNQIDIAHANYLRQISELLEHNAFLTSQASRIHDFYEYMSSNYPNLAFTFKGRIKSLIRAEEKFNAYVAEYIYDYHRANEKYPSVPQIKDALTCFRDLIAYRVVISVPRCHLESEESRRDVEINLLYGLANTLPEFLEVRGFTPQLVDITQKRFDERLDENARMYYRDYIANVRPLGYESLHITLYDNLARCYIEVQLRTKTMDDNAEIGPANHLGYEKRQDTARLRRDCIKEGECLYFDEAYERGMMLQNLELNKLDVNMFAAVDNYLINDGCGLYRGRQITPFEHLSRFQSDK